MKKKKVKKKLKTNAPCGCSIDVSCGICVLSPMNCTSSILGAFCPSFSNIILASAVVELAKVIGHECAMKYCGAVCVAKKKANEEGSCNWTEFLPFPWNKFFQTTKTYHNFFQNWYAWMLYEKAAILGKLDLKDDEDLEALKDMATQNKLFYGKEFRKWFLCQDCWPCCVPCTSHKSHRSLKMYMSKRNY